MAANVARPAVVGAAAVLLADRRHRGVRRCGLSVGDGTGDSREGTPEAAPRGSVAEAEVQPALGRGGGAGLGSQPVEVGEAGHGRAQVSGRSVGVLEGGGQLSQILASRIGCYEGTIRGLPQVRDEPGDRLYTVTSWSSTGARAARALSICGGVRAVAASVMWCCQTTRRVWTNTAWWLRLIGASPCAGCPGKGVGGSAVLWGSA